MPFGSFTHDFTSQAYTEAYYADVDIQYITTLHTRPPPHPPTTYVGQENAWLMYCYAHYALPLLQCNSYHTLLEVGGGSTLYQLLSIAQYVERIFFTDYVEALVTETKQWCAQPTSKWDAFIYASLYAEYGCMPSVEACAKRKQLLISKLHAFGTYDVLHNTCADDSFPVQYDVVHSSFCIESITDIIHVWKQACASLASRVCTHGMLIMTALKEASYYIVGNHTFPAVPITRKLIAHTLSLLGFTHITIYEQSIADSSVPYRGMYFITALKTEENL